MRPAGPSGAVAVIPARGGSRRIPGKNIRPFAGRPMIAHSIAAAQDSGVFDRVVVSTDDDAVAEVARAWGAEVPFLRPAGLADDHTPTAPVVLHALDCLEANGEGPVFACCLYPTAPLVRPQDLRRGLERLRETGAAVCFSVASFASPIQRALGMDEAGRLSMFWPEHLNTRSQDLPGALHDAGQFYWVDVARFRADPRFYGPDSVGIVLPRHRVQDIDTPEDWETAEILYRAMQLRAGEPD